MVLPNHSRCMILTMVGNFDHLLPTLRQICGLLGRKSLPWLPMLPSRRLVRKRSVLDQIPILWKVKLFRGEGGNGLTLRTSLAFLFEILISSLLSGGMVLLSLFFA